MLESPLRPSQNASPSGRGTNFSEKLWGPPPLASSLRIFPSSFISGDEGEIKDNESSEGEQPGDGKYPCISKGTSGRGSHSHKSLCSSLQGSYQKTTPCISKGTSGRVLTLVNPFAHLFEDLISKLLLIFLPQELNKFNLEFKFPGIEIFYSSKMTLVSKKMKDRMPDLPHAFG